MEGQKSDCYQFRNSWEGRAWRLGVDCSFKDFEILDCEKGVGIKGEEVDVVG